MASGELSRTKSLIVLAVVVGCFAILWPKIFYPMFQTSVTPPTVSPPTANLPPKEQFPGKNCASTKFVFLPSFAIINRAHRFLL